MESAEFKQLVRLKTSHLPQADVDFAIGYNCYVGKTERYHVTDCVMLAGEASRHFRNGEKTLQEVEQSGSVSTSGRMLIGRRIMEQLAPWIKRIRRDLFGHEAAPFETYAEAVRWLKKQATLQPQRTEDERQRGLTLFREAQALAREAGTLLKQSATCSLSSLTLPYYEPPTQALRLLPLTLGSVLWRLSDAARMIADASGFPTYLVIAHIMADMPLVPPPATFRITQRSADLAGHFGATDGTPLLARTAISIDFADPQQVTPRTFMELYRRIRKELGATKAKPLKPQHESLYQLVQEAGGPPAKKSETIGFWTHIQHLYRHRYGKTYKDWRGPYIAYQRLKARLDADAVHGRGTKRRRRR